MPEKNAPEASRIDALDALRGLAALSVVLNHCLMTSAQTAAVMAPIAPPIWTPAALLTHSPLRIAFSGVEAVLLFFILSGLVLGRAFAAGRGKTYLGFVQGRLARLYLPYLIAVALSVVLLTLGAGRGPTTDTSRWFDAMWSRPVDGPALLDLLLMLDGQQGPQASNSFNVLSPAWSLVHEMRISLLFPLIVWLVLRLDWRLSLVGAVALSAAVDAVARALGADDGAAYTWLLSAYLSSFFVVGATLARHWTPIVSKLHALPRQAIVGLALLAWLLVAWRGVVGWWLPAADGRLVSDWANAGGAVLLITLAGSGRLLPGLLTHPLASALGRISYSLYLTHVLLLLLLVHALGDRPIGAVVALVPILSLGAAVLFNRLVEEPCRRLGRPGAANLRLRRPATALPTTAPLAQTR